MARGKTKKRLFLLLLAVALLTGGLSGCSAKASSSEDRHSAMPQELMNAPQTVQEAYRFAVDHPETLQQFPCYCGCGAMGHTSNYSCYVQEVDSAGVITYDTHALGCSICVDITQDVMRLTKEQKTIPEIQAYVDTVYSQYGPSNLQ